MNWGDGNNGNFGEGAQVVAMILLAGAGVGVIILIASNLFGGLLWLLAR